MKSNSNKKNILTNETKNLKNDFKKMIDEMPDEDFIDMVLFLLNNGSKKTLEPLSNQIINNGENKKHFFYFYFQGEA